MVVEDDESVRELARLILEGYGYRCSPSPDADAAGASASAAPAASTCC